MPQLERPSFQEIPLISAYSLAGSALAVTEPLFVGNVPGGRTLFVKASGNTKVYPLVGPNDSDCVYKLKGGTGIDTEDSDREWDVDDEAIAFQLVEFSSYLSLVVLNEDVTATTVSAWLA